MDAQPIPDSPVPRRQQSADVLTVLTSLSPERMNRQSIMHQSSESAVPSSPAPSVGSPIKAHLFQDPFLSSRRGSDVQGKVAQFNNLSRTTSQRKQELEKALERARLGREQAEAENAILKDKIGGYMDRERRVGLRLEETMEENEKLQSDLHKTKGKYERAKEALTHSKERFREELRRMKGAEFKADSNQLAAQQALQSERQLVKSLEMELKLSREKHDQIEKESFASQIKLLEMDEQLTRLQQQIKLVEEERNALKTSLKSEEVARIAAEGRIPLPRSDTPDEFSSPKRHREPQMSAPRRPLSRAAVADPFKNDSRKHGESQSNAPRRPKSRAAIADSAGDDSKKNREPQIHVLRRPVSRTDIADSVGKDGKKHRELQAHAPKRPLSRTDNADLVGNDGKKHREPQSHASRRPLSRADVTDPFGNDNKKRDKEIASLPCQLEIESFSRKGDKDMVNILKLECHFNRCSCRLPSKQGDEYILDEDFEKTFVGMRTEYEAVRKRLLSQQGLSHPSTTSRKVIQQPPSLIDSRDDIQFIPETGTFRTAKPRRNPAAEEVLLLLDSDTQEALTDRTVIAVPSIPIVPDHVTVPNVSNSTGSIGKSTTHVCQALPSESGLQYNQLVDINDDHEEVTKTPTTPIAAETSTSDADLLLFTPFVFPQPQKTKPPIVPQDTISQPKRKAYAAVSAQATDQELEASDLKSQHSSSYPPLLSKPRKLQTVTTTTTVPLAPEPVTPPQSLVSSTSAPAGMAFTPGTTKSREEALACIRSWRKGNAEAHAAAMTSRDTNVRLPSEIVPPAKQRSRSVVVSTPARRKWTGTSTGEREKERDISAPMRI